MKLLFTIVVVAVVLSIGEALQCYKHGQTYDSFNKEKAVIVDCPFSCEKDVAELTTGIMYVRGCGVNPNVTIERAKRSTENAKIKVVHQYICTEDLCNGVAVSVPLILTLATTIAAVLLNHS